MCVCIMEGSEGGELDGGADPRQGCLQTDAPEPAWSWDGSFLYSRAKVIRPERSPDCGLAADCCFPVRFLFVADR